MIPTGPACMAEDEQPWRTVGRGLEVVEASPPVAILRVRHPDEALHQALGRAFGLTWPCEVGRMADDLVGTLAPGEWAIFAQNPDGPVAAACKDRIHHLAAVGEGRRSWRISGVASRRVLAKLTSLDVHISAFPRGCCRQTLVAQVPALLVRPETGPDRFLLTADVSFTVYLRACLSASAREFQS